MLLCSFLPFCFIHFIHHFSCLLLATITASVQVSMQIKFETLASVMFRIVHLLKNRGRQHSWDVLMAILTFCLKHVLEHCYKTSSTAMYMLRILASDVPPCMVWLARYFIQSEISIHANCNNLICCKVSSKTCYIAFHLMEQVARFFTLVFKLTQYVLSFVNVFASKHDCFPLWLVLFFRHPKIWKATCSLTERISTAFFTLKSHTRRLQNSVFVSWWVNDCPIRILVDQRE